MAGSSEGCDEVDVVVVLVVLVVVMRGGSSYHVTAPTTH